MNSQQYNRANKRVFLAVIIVFAYIAFTLFAAVGTKDADITRISIQLVAAIAVIVIAVIAFITKRDSRTGALILVSAMTAGYFIIALINSTIGTWTYALPLVIAAMIYLDIKMMMVMNAVIIISSVIRLVMQLGIGGTVLQNDVIAVFVLVLVGYASDSITILLTHFFDENMEEIKESAMAQVDSNKKMVMVAENISKHFDEAMTMLNDLDESVAVSHSSIQEIADSTESTAEAIQKQAAMCVDIQGNTDNAESGIKAMIDASRQTDETVKQGADVVEELKEQAHNVAEASNVTFELNVHDIAYLDEAISYAKMGLVPAGAYKNKGYSYQKVDFRNVEDHFIDLLYDPQTSGGLLISVEAQYAEAVMEAFEKKRLDTKVSLIGTVTEKSDKLIRLH